ncbi:MAG: hypothetical protein FJ150_01160 [Euryarchaeota archaeon]|nr:hypothetical protein [Euryarchaeota archaeon]
MKLCLNDLKPNNIVIITVDGGPHYSVVKEITNESIKLADPSLGNIEMSKEKFSEVYSENALVITDPNAAALDVSSSIQVNGTVEQTSNETDANSTSVQADNNKTLTDEEMQGIKGKGGWIYVWVWGRHYVYWRYVVDRHWAYYGYGKYGYTFAYIYGPRWIWDPHWEYGWYKKRVYCIGTLPYNYAGLA